MPGLKITLLQHHWCGWMVLPTCAILIVNWKDYRARCDRSTGDVYQRLCHGAAASSLAQDDVVNWMTAKAHSAMR